MSSKRLNNDIRARIIKAAIEKAGINKLQNEINKRRNSLAVKAHASSHGGPEKYKIIQSILDGVRESMKTLESDYKISIRMTTSNSSEGYSFGGCRDTLSYGSDKNGEDLSLYSASWENRLFAADHPLSVEWNEIRQHQEVLSSQKEKVTQAVTAAVNSVTTVKRLLEIWPEAAELLPDDVEESKPSFPAISVDDLNAIVGLPSGEKK